MSKEKITISEIIDLMASKNESSKKQTEEFVKTLLSTIEDTLIEGEIVKIKDFGTFKPQWNEPRKSVDVNTGDEITIPGYYKVVFLPDNTFKELINKPYAHLEAIEQKTTVAPKEKELPEVEKIEKAEKIVEQPQPQKKEEDVKSQAQVPSQPDSAKVTIEPMRMFEEQATQIKGILYEIEALSGKPSKLPPKTETTESNLSDATLVNGITPYNISSILSDNKKIDNDADSDESQYTYTFEDSKTRKYRKKLEQEERKERKREQIKQYFSDNKFDLVREVKVEEVKEVPPVEEPPFSLEPVLQESATEEEKPPILSVSTDEITTPQDIKIDEFSFDDELEEQVESMDSGIQDHQEEDIQVVEVKELPNKKITQKHEGEDKKDVNVIVNLIVNQGEDGKLQLKEATTPKPTKQDIIEEVASPTPTELVETQVTEEPKAQVAEEETLIVSPNNEDVDYTFVQIRKKRNRIWLFIVLPILLAALGYGIWFYFPAIKSFIKPYWESYFPTKNDQPATIKEDTSVASNKPVVVDSLENQAQDTLATEDLFKKDRDYKEFIASEVLKPGTQLSALAKKYLNHPYFWIYIYEANIDVIEDPNHIPIGTVIKIPKMDSRLINVNNPECLKYAEKLANEYLYYDNK